MQYLSCFSGIGGLESARPPLAVCEIDAGCREVLARRFPDAERFDNILNMPPLDVEVVVGGWPCQDLSVAGRKKGLSGANSGLFYAFAETAHRSGAHTLIAENVTNLLKMDGGATFAAVLEELVLRGYEYCSWRTLNAREFGLPHHRNRVFIIASQIRSASLSLFRPIPDRSVDVELPKAAGFYWTGGIQSICYSDGYVPTIKVGTGLSIASPPAVFYADIVRQLSTAEALLLQGFDPSLFQGISKSAVYKMAGNAVAQPVGRFVVDGVLAKEEFEPTFLPTQSDLFGSSIPNGGFPSCGLLHKGQVYSVQLAAGPLAHNLHDFLLKEDNSPVLSRRAAVGLLGRLARSGLNCPEPLRRSLQMLAA